MQGGPGIGPVPRSCFVAAKPITVRERPGTVGVMRVIVRTDASAKIGGGHLMRSLALADALRARGAQVAFVSARDGSGWTDRVVAAGYPLYAVAPTGAAADPQGPAHAHWLCTSWQDDARISAAAARDFGADWVVWDHYGLDARWVDHVRTAQGAVRVLAVDDLDDRPLGSDLVLDQTRLGTGARRYPALAMLAGPDFATLRPEFAALRKTMSLPRRPCTGAARVLVTIGLADPAGILPGILHSLAGFPELEIDVVTGAQAQSLPEVRRLCDTMPKARLHIDTRKIAQLMAHADLCIGAGGMTSWERCALGLGTLLVPVADNQIPVAKALEAAGAVHVLPLEDARDPASLHLAIKRLLRFGHVLGQNAAGLCDGNGAGRVADILLGGMRPVVASDARLLFKWRNKAHIRAASLNSAPLAWADHQAWIAGLDGRQDGVWWIYSEGDKALGHVNAQRQADGSWQWGFYVGADDAPRGTGRRMLAMALGKLFSRPDCTMIRAVVRHDNPRSIALHKSLGFVECADSGDQGGALVFCLHECDMQKAFSITFPKGQTP